MHPSMGDQIKRAAAGNVITKIDFDVMVASHALITPTSKCIQILLVKLAHDFSNVVSIVINRARDFGGSGNRRNREFWRGYHETFIYENVCADGMIHHH